MAQRAGRVTCPKCGANNFDTVTSCWKCGTPMGAGATAMAAAPMAQAAPPYVERPSSQQPQMMGYAPAMPSGVAAGDIGVARRAAIALALTIPWIGLPVGWVFMMIEDSRKQAIGRVCANWSMLGLVLHLVIMGWMTVASVNFLVHSIPDAMIQSLKSRAAQSGEGAEGGGGTGLPRGYPGMGQ